MPVMIGGLVLFSGDNYSEDQIAELRNVATSRIMEFWPETGRFCSPVYYVKGSPMRTLCYVGDSTKTRVVVLDEPGAGGACHEYEVETVGRKGNEIALATIHFQNGPIKESGVNGCQQEDLLAIVIDRLRAFQAGPFPCKENGKALAHAKAALQWLNLRTEQRKKRGVEGKSKK
jgi:hypothetical protein